MYIKGNPHEEQGVEMEISFITKRQRGGHAARSRGEENRQQGNPSSCFQAVSRIILLDVHWNLIPSCLLPLHLNFSLTQTEAYSRVGRCFGFKYKKNMGKKGPQLGFYFFHFFLHRFPPCILPKSY
ncbi:hypothetical protein EXN66_Car000768 [Channa argus]|uniref:Uncharacterized protein n=1 Tax=Channa argus TaxID=215402 RepID=A0A6G1QYJ7_CHAAH|nr:hypothetical protein EXN66_Car000768 [Channa argus]